MRHYEGAAHKGFALIHGGEKLIGLGVVGNHNMVCAAVQRRAHCGIVGGVFGVQHYGKAARLKILGLLAGESGHYGDVGVCAVYGKRTLRAGFIGYKTLAHPLGGYFAKHLGRCGNHDEIGFAALLYVLLKLLSLLPAVKLEHGYNS